MSRSAVRRLLGCSVIALLIAPFTPGDRPPGWSPRSSLTTGGSRSSTRHTPVPAATAANRRRVVETFGALPLHFEANAGQADAGVQFVARGAGYAMALTGREAILRVPVRSTKDAPEPAALRRALDGPAARWGAGVPESRDVRIEMVGASGSVSASGENELPGKANYFLGNDPEKWRTNVPTYAKARYHDVYPGIDVVYYGNQQQLEHDYIVAPGADPRLIRLRLSGVDRVAIDTAGDVVGDVSSTEMRVRLPRIYQEDASGRQPVTGRYVWEHDGIVGVEIAAYDTRRTLVIDPVIEYSLTLGGNAQDFGQAIAVDGSGGVYITGFTTSTDFPVTEHAFQSSQGQAPWGMSAGLDAFVVKLDPSGSPMYSTYLGGESEEFGLGLAVDSAGSAYVVGATTSYFFPTKNPIQPHQGSSWDGFLTKLDPTGSALVYSTYLGGAGDDELWGVAVDPTSGAAVVVGRALYYTSDTFFPVWHAVQPSFGGGTFDALVMKVDAAGSTLVYSTFLGGSGDEIAEAVAVDSFGAAYVTGYTTSANFPTTDGSFQPTLAGSGDAFVTKLSSAGTFDYSTFLGGSGREAGGTIAVDATGAAYVAGSTNSTDFPTVNPMQANQAGGFDGFVTKVSPSGTALRYSTYIGGSSFDSVLSIAVDGIGEAYLVGSTQSVDFPQVNGITGAPGPTPQPLDVTYITTFIAKLTSDGASSVYQTYAGAFRVSAYGGSKGSYGGPVMAIDSTGSMYIVGWITTCNGCDHVLVDKFAETLPTDVGAITVSTAIDGTGTITFDTGAICPGMCRQTYSPDHTVTLTAVPVPGAYLAQWQNCPGTVSGTTCTFTATTTVSGIVASFENTPLGSSTVQQPDGSVSFSNVTASGTTTIKPIDPSTAGQVSGGFSLTSIAFDVTTSAVYAPSSLLTVCFAVPTITDLATFASLRVLHNEGGTLRDRTILPPDAPAPDFATKTICALVDSLSPFVIVTTSSQVWHAGYHNEYDGARTAGDLLGDGLYGFDYTWRFGILSDQNGGVNSPTINVTANGGLLPLTPDPNDATLTGNAPQYIWTGPNLSAASPTGNQPGSFFFTSLRSHVPVVYPLGYAATRNLAGGSASNPRQVAALATESRTFTLALTPSDPALAQLGATIDFNPPGPVSASNISCSADAGQIAPAAQLYWQIGNATSQQTLGAGVTSTLTCGLSLTNAASSPALYSPTVTVTGERTVNVTQAIGNSTQLTTDPNADPSDPLGSVEFDVTPTAASATLLLERYFDRTAHMDGSNVVPAKSDQTITLPSIADQTFGNPDVPVTATATSGLPVTVTASGACTWTGSAVHLTGVGTCVVTASQAGDTNYNQAPTVAQSFAIAPPPGAATSISGVAGTGAYGATASLTASLTSAGTPISGKVVRFTVRGSQVGNATTDANGLATLSGVSLAGIAASPAPYVNAIAASFSGDSADLASSGSGDLIVRKATPAVVWTPPALTYGTPLGAGQLNAVATASIDGSIVSVAGAFAYTPDAGAILNAGNQILSATFTPADAANMNSVTTQVAVSVEKASQTITLAAWQARAAMAVGRLYAAAGVVDGVMYVTGNYPGSTSLDAYDPGANTWTNLASMPTGRYLHAAAGAAGALYALGGPGLNTMDAYDPATNTWSAKASMSTARYIPSAVVVNGLLYAIGGYNGGFLDSMEAYDPATNTWAAKAPMPTARSGAAAGVIDGKIYVVGGSNCPGCNYLDTVEAYDPATDTWTAKSPMPTPRYLLGVGVLNGALYAVGGYNANSRRLDTVEIYDPATDTWTTGAPMPTARNGLTVGVANGALYAAGGEGPDGSFLTTNESFGALGDRMLGDADFPVSAAASSGLSVALAASGACTISGTTVHLTGAGSCTITASQSGDANHTAASAAQTFSIAKAAQAITFGALAGKTYGDADFTISATASSGLTVGFAAAGSCTVTDSLVHLTGAGTCTITASQPGDSTYTAAPAVTQTFAVAKAASHISVTGYTGVYDGKVHGATGLATGVNAEDLSGLLNLGSSFTDAPGGTAHWTFAGTTNYAAASGDVAIVITKADQTITFAALPPRTFGNSDFDLMTRFVTDGPFHSCAVTNGGVKCWGYNGSGQLGDGTFTNRVLPVDVSGITDAQTVVAGGNHTCVLTTAGAVKCWGLNTSGQVGDGTTISPRLTPVTVSGLSSGVLAITAGSSGHNCALMADRTVKCWGYNLEGQLGDGTTTNRTTPVQVSGLSGVTGISAGGNHTCAVASGGGLKCWGKNQWGAVGDGTTDYRQTPVDVVGLTSGVKSVAAGGDHTCAFLTSGPAKCWGYNGFGELGDGTTNNRSVPVFVSGLSSPTAMVGGGVQTCAITSGGGLQCWGFNGNGELGDGTTTSHLTPTTVPGLNPVQIAAGADHTCAASSDGEVRCWAFNAYGQVGDGTTTNRLTPTAVSNLGPLPVVASSGLPVSYSASGACSISGSTVHLTGAGDCTITASQKGNADYNAAPDVSRTFTIGKASSTTSIASSQNPATAASPLTFTATVTAPASSTPTGTVTFKDGVTTLDTTALDGSGHATLTTSTLSASGSPHAITAVYNGDANDNTSTSATLSQTISKQNQTIVFAALAGKTYGDPDFTVSATASSGLAVTFGASGSCTISGNSVHLTGAGSCTITASQAGNANYSAAVNVPQTFAIAKANQTITAFGITLKPAFSATGTMGTPRVNPVVLRLFDGTVLVAGGSSQPGGAVLASAERYDPAAGTFSATGSLTIARTGAAFTRLADGRILLAGGSDGTTPLKSAELYDLSTGTFSRTGDLAIAREGASAWTLDDGTVLVVGGATSVAEDSASAEMYDPGAGTFTRIADMHVGRPSSPSAVQLADATVLITGGTTATGAAEVFDPATWTFREVGSLSTPRVLHSATPLPNGRVLVAGGYNGGALSSTELYDPTTQTFVPGPPMTAPHYAHVGMGIPAGGVLVAGGSDGVSASAVAEVYGNDRFVAIQPMTVARIGARASGLPGMPGRILVVGGSGTGSNGLASADLLRFNASAAAALTLPLPDRPFTVPDGPVTATATSGLAVQFSAAGSCLLTGASLPLHVTAPGTCTVTATQAGNTNYNAAPSVSQTFTVHRAINMTAVASSANPATAGQTITFTSTVTPFANTTVVPSGTITFTDGGVAIGTATLDATGTATLSTAALTAAGSPHTIRAQYSGDAFYIAESSAPLAQNIQKADTVTVLVSSLSSATYGHPTTLTATVTSSAGVPTGTVTFHDAGGTIVLGPDGRASLALIDGVGSHTYTAEYNGDANFAPSVSAPVSATVTAAPTTVAIGSSNASATVGDAVTLTAVVTGTPEALSGSGQPPQGLVTFTDGSGPSAVTLGTQVLQNGVATLTTSALALGTHSISASYGGDAVYASSVSAPFVETIAPPPVTIRIVPAPTDGTIAGPGGLRCGSGGSTCAATVAIGTTVTLSASADSSHVFGGWTGACASNALQPSCTLLLTIDTTAGALFNPRPTMLTVDSGADLGDARPGDGICAASTGACTLRAAVQEANALGTALTIAFDPALDGTPMTVGAALAVTNPALTINGNGAANTIVQGCDAQANPSCTGADRIVDLADGARLTIGGVTLRNGSADGGGGGAIRVGAHLPWEPGYGGPSALVLSDALLLNNRSASFGGAIITIGSVTITNTRFAGNQTVNYGGAISAGLESTLSIANSTFSGNQAVAGGAIFTNAPGAVTIAGSTFNGNQVIYDGGALSLNEGGPYSITNSTLSGNVVSGSDPTIGGGAIFAAGAQVHVASATINGNGAPVGGAIHSYQGAAVTLTNTIVAGSGGGTCVTTVGGGIASAGYNLSDDASCGFTSTGDLLAVAKLGPLADNGGPTFTHALLAGSPAINAGNPAGCTDAEGRPLTTDQRGEGFPRAAVGRCDTGAFEAQPPLAQVITFASLTDRTYGDPDFAVSATASSGLSVTFSALGNCTVAGSTVHVTTPGSCTITASQDGDADYNPASDVAQPFSIAPASLLVRADDRSRTYGATSMFTASYLGFVNGDGPESLAGALAFTPDPLARAVGSYAIVPSGLTSSNYAITFATGTLAVTPAPLLVKANDASKPYGYPNPSFAPTYTGFVLGQDPTVLGGILTFSTAATTTSDVGSYAIRPGGLTSANYAIAFADGVLTVNTALPTVDGGWTVSIVPVQPHGVRASITGAGTTATIATCPAGGAEHVDLSQAGATADIVCVDTGGVGTGSHVTAVNQSVVVRDAPDTYSATALTGQTVTVGSPVTAGASNTLPILVQLFGHEGAALGSFDLPPAGKVDVQFTTGPNGEDVANVQVLVGTIALTINGQTTTLAAGQPARTFSLGARAVMQTVLADLGAVRAGAASRQDSDRLGQAIAHLTKAVDPAFWVDALHLQPTGGEQALNAVKDSVDKLVDLMKQSAIASATLENAIARLVGAARTPAVLAIHDATAAGGRQGQIDQAGSELAAGDADAAAGKVVTAIEHYRNAWTHAGQVR